MKLEANQNSRDALSTAPTQAARDIISEVMLFQPRPLTAREIAQACVDARGGDFDTYRKRMAELVRSQTLTKCESRECSHTGKTATTYKRA